MTGTVAVSISKPGQSVHYGQPVEYSWPLKIPLYMYTDNWQDVDNMNFSLKERLDYRANRRNIAVILALEKYPDTEHIIMIDSWYINQSNTVMKLLERYRQLPLSATIGPAIWGRLCTTISQVPSYYLNRQRFYDAWATPELRWCPRGWLPQHDILTSQELMPLSGLYRVSSIGGCYVFPRAVWDHGARYGVPSDLHGCEHNFFHSAHRLPNYIDFTVRLERVKKYSLAHCARCSLGNYLRTRKL